MRHLDHRPGPWASAAILFVFLFSITFGPWVFWALQDWLARVLS